MLLCRATDSLSRSRFDFDQAAPSAKAERTARRALVAVGFDGSDCRFDLARRLSLTPEANGWTRTSLHDFTGSNRALLGRRSDNH
jgi:hypothetical protein